MRIIVNDFTSLFFGKKLVRTILLDALSKGLPYVFLPFFLNLMSLAEFGLYSYITFIAMSGAYVFQFGFETAKSKLYFAYDKEEIGKMLYGMNLFILLLFIVVVITDLKFQVICRYILGINENIKFEFLIIVLIFGNSVMMLIMRHLSLQGNILTYQIWNTLRILFGNLLPIVIIALFLNSSLGAFERVKYDVVVNILFLIPIYIWYYYRYFKHSIDLKIMSRVLKISIPVVFGGIIGIAYNLSDKYFIQKFINYNSLAVYNLAFYLVMPIGLLFTSFFETYWVPKFFKENNVKINLEATNKTVFYLFLLFSLILPIFLVTIYIYLKITSNPIKFETIFLIFLLLYFAKTIDIFSQFYNNFFILTEKTYKTTIINLIISIFVIIFNSITIKKYGIIGASFVLLGAALIKFIIFFLSAHKIVNKKTA